MTIACDQLRSGWLVISSAPFRSGVSVIQHGNCLSLSQSKADRLVGSSEGLEKHNSIRPHLGRASYNKLFIALYGLIPLTMANAHISKRDRRTKLFHADSLNRTQKLNGKYL